jgi:hypothetical protein
MGVAVSTYTVFATVLGTRYELSVTVRIGALCRLVEGGNGEHYVSDEQLSGMVAHTIATWERVIEAVVTQSWELADFAGKAWPSAESKQGVTLQENEPFVTVWNKEWNSKGLGVTVHSWDDGYAALASAHAMIKGLEKLAPHADKFGIEKLEYAPLPSVKVETPKTPAIAPKKLDKDDVDSFLGTTPPSTQESSDSGASLPFRMFKQLAPNIIQVQEFKQGGGGDKYQKSAILATLPYHQKNVQYEDDSLIYYPITEAIQIVEGQFGTQALIPTANGRVYVSMTNKSCEETPDWHNFAQDLHENYQDLLDNRISKFYAPDCVLIMKTGKQKDAMQWKNYYHIYKPFKETAKA